MRELNSSITRGAPTSVESAELRSDCVAGQFRCYHAMERASNLSSPLESVECSIGSSFEISLNLWQL